MLSIAVAVTTLSTLALPAVTMSKEPCQLAEHLHNENCYTPVTERSLICTLAESEGHLHGAGCYELKEADPGHTHIESCYTGEEGELTCAETERAATEAGTVLICLEPEIAAHQHEESCFMVAQASGLSCQLPEHTHTEACLPEETTPTQPENDSDEDVFPEDMTAEALTPNSYTLVHEGEDYTITVTYGDEAMLPEDVSLAVEELLPGTDTYESYYAQSAQALQNENIVYARLFDIQFIAAGVQVEPAAAVQVDIHYDEPLPVEAATAQVVHFGETGTEVLPVETEQSAGGITDITHVQTGFSVTAYVFVENMDHGPNKLLVDWYVYLDKQWTKVGSTRTGWLATQSSGTAYDYISEGQAKYVLGDYGFEGGADGWESLAYRKIKTYGTEPTMYPGIFNVTDGSDGDGNHYYQLSEDKTVDSYCIYFVPNTGAEIQDANGTEHTTYAKHGDKIGVYTVQVYDPYNLVYSAGVLQPKAYAVHGSDVELVIKNRPNNEDRWYLYRPSLTKIGPIEDFNGSTITDNGDGTSTLVLKGVQQSIYIARELNTMTSEVPPDPLEVDYYIYIQNSAGTYQWQHVGTTHSGWTISGRKAAGAAYYTDPNYQANGTLPNSGLAAVGEGYARDVISMSQVVDVLGKFGFSPAVNDDFSLRNSGASAQASQYRIKRIGYQKLNTDGTQLSSSIFFDTYYDSFNEQLIYPLSQHDSKASDGTPQSCARYNVYFVPDGAPEGSYASQNEQELLSPAKVGRKDVEYYVHLDGSWTKVGTSHYYSPGKDANTRDALGIRQLYEFLEPYGFPKTGPTNAKELFYKDKTGKFFNNSSVEDGQYKLALLADRPSGAYQVYWMPDTTASHNGVNGVPVIESGRFYLFQVFEPSNSIYESITMCPRIYVRHGQEGILEVKPTGSETMDWVVKGIDRNTTLMMGDGPEEIVNSDGTKSVLKREKVPETGFWRYTFTNMQRTAIVAFPYSNGDRSLSNNYATADVIPAVSNLVDDPNISFTMHNYSTRINEYLHTLGLASFNDDLAPVMKSDNSGYSYQEQDLEKTYLSFRGFGGNEVSYSPYLDNDPFQRNHATVKRNLDSDGYPSLDVTHHGYTTAERLQGKGFTDDDITAWQEKASNAPSLDFLFGGGGTQETGQNGVTKIADQDGTTYVMNYMDNVNTPLQIINGKYQYFSYFNAADFNTREQKWYVRDYVERTEATSSYLTKDDYGDFLPFNHSGGDLIPGRYYNYYQEDVDYWYGMTMRTRFYMSEGGRNDSGPMAFSFAGDDDVYAFVDGKLVLDVGGTHGSCSGTINFETGLVEAYYDFNGETAGPQNLVSATKAAQQQDPYTQEQYHRYYSTTIYEAYKAALEEEGKDAATVQAELDKIFVKIAEKKEPDHYGKEYDVYRFKDYSAHDLDYFYLERGSSVANCNIQFNLSTLPKEALTVSKAVNYEIVDPTEDDKIFYTTAEKHSFRIIGKESQAPLKGSIGYTYPVYTAAGEPAGTVTADSHGIFQIAAGQRVTAEDINVWLKQELEDTYIVQELVPESHVLSGTPVNINGSSVQGGDPVTIAGVTYIPYAQDEIIGAGDRDVVFTPYTNLRSLKMAGYLVLEKQVSEGNATDVDFSMKVSVNGTPVPQGTKFYPVDANGVPLDEAGNYVRADANGVVKIKPNTRYRLGAKLIPGYTFTVEEVNIPEGWAFASYTVDGTQKDAATGTIENQKTHTVVVKNKTAAVNLDIPLSKQFIGMDRGDAKSRTATFMATEMELTNGEFTLKPGAAAIQPVTITCTGNVANTGKIQLAYPENTPSGRYYYQVRETNTKAQDGETFFNDTAEYIVVVNIAVPEGQTKQVAKVTAIYKDGVLISGTDGSNTVENGPNTLMFVNQRGGAALPMTGGVGTTWYTLLGGAMVLFACARMYRSKRNMRKEAE